MKRMDFDDLKNRGGSGLGTAAVTIFDKSGICYDGSIHAFR